MTRQTVRNAYSEIHPTQEQKDKMWNAIQEKKQESPVTVRREKPFAVFRPSTIAAALSFAAVLAVVIWFGGSTLARNQSGATEMMSMQAETNTAMTAADREQGVVTGTMKESEASEDRSVTASGAAEDSMYRPVLEKYVAAIRKNKDPGQCAGEDISMLVGNLTGLDQLGWCLRDLDGNGTQELIVSDGKVIYDLYTLENGEPVHLVTGAERNTYRLCENGIIKNFGSNSAAESGYTMYRLVDSSLVEEQIVTFDAARDSQNPWFVGFEQAPASEAEAQAVIDSYKEIEIPVNAFSQGEW